MNHRSLIVSLAALALAACTPESPGNPVAPDLAAVGSRATAGAELPFHGTLETRETPQFQPATGSLLVHLVGTGTATHLGRYAAVGDFTVALATATSVGSITLTAANGDIITATFIGRDAINGGVAAVVETATITGGTGRFAGATGSFTIRRSLDLATNISSGSFDGTITFRK